MTEPYSQTTWLVKPGLEDEFVERWRELAAWSALQGLRASAKLFRDVDEPRRFMSFGPWESLEAIRRWRTEPGFHEHMARLGEVVEHLEPRTLELIAER